MSIMGDRFDEATMSVTTETIKKYVVLSCLSVSSTTILISLLCRSELSDNVYYPGERGPRRGAAEELLENERSKVCNSVHMDPDTCYRCTKFNFAF